MADNAEKNTEKEIYLVVDFVDSPDSFIDDVKAEDIKFVNLEGTNPGIQIGDHVFKGNYVHSLDTNLIFEVPKTTDVPASGRQQTPKEFIGQSTKVLEAKRAILGTNIHTDIVTEK